MKFCASEIRKGGNYVKHQTLCRRVDSESQRNPSNHSFLHARRRVAFLLTKEVNVDVVPEQRFHRRNLMPRNKLGLEF